MSARWEIQAGIWKWLWKLGLSNYENLYVRATKPSNNTFPSLFSFLNKHIQAGTISADQWTRYFIFVFHRKFVLRPKYQEDGESIFSVILANAT